MIVEENSVLRDQLTSGQVSGEMIGHSTAMQPVFSLLGGQRRKDAAVLQPSLVDQPDCARLYG